MGKKEKIEINILEQLILPPPHLLIIRSEHLKCHPITNLRIRYSPARATAWNSTWRPLGVAFAEGTPR